MSHHHHSDPVGAKAQEQLPGEMQGAAEGGVAVAERHPAASTEPDDRDPVTYEAGWDSTAGAQGALLGGMVYAWWLFIGGAFEILFGGMYLGTPQETQVHVSTAWYSLICVVVGVLMVTIGFGILRLERWVYWAGWLVTFAYGALSAIEIVRWAQGTPIVAETVFFAFLNLLFALYNVYFLLQADTRKLLRFRLFKGGPFSPGIAISGVALAIPALALTLFVNHIDRHLSEPAHLLAYLLAGVLAIVMAVMGLRLRRWVWWADLAWAVMLVGLSIYFIAHQLTDVILPQHKGAKVDTEGMIFSAVNFAFVAIAVYYLFLRDLRAAVFGARRKQALFSLRTLIGGLSLGVLALAIYLLPGDLGKPALAYTVVGLVMGAVVGLLPGADPANRLSGYFVGMLLAFASYVARGGLLPYTKGSAAVIVLLMFVVGTGITAVVRSRAWFVLMLLGVGTMYGLVEPLFDAAPSAYLASAGLAFVGILLGFGVGFTVSSLLELDLVPYKSSPVLTSHTTAGSSATSREPTRESTQPEADPR